MILLRIALEWGCLPSVIEATIDAATFWELAACLKLRDEAQAKAYAAASKGAGHTSSAGTVDTQPAMFGKR